MSTQEKSGIKLSSLTINHLEFVLGLKNSGMITEQQGLELITEAWSMFPKGAKQIMLPITTSMLDLIYNYITSGRRRIAIYIDDRGEKYIAASFVKNYENS